MGATMPYIYADTVIDFSDSGLTEIGLPFFDLVSPEEFVASYSDNPDIRLSLDPNAALRNGTDPEDYLLLTTGSFVTLQLPEPVMPNGPLIGGSGNDVATVDIYLDAAFTSRRSLDQIEVAVQSPGGAFVTIGATFSGTYALEDAGFTGPVSAIRLTSVLRDVDRFSAHNYVALTDVRIFGEPLDPGPDSLPDLVASNFLISTEDWIPGEMITATFDIVNQGTAATDGAVDFDLQVPTSAGEILQFGQIDGPLAPGESRSVVVDFEVPVEFGGRGKHFLEVSVDPANVVTESDEDNNFSGGQEFLVRPVVFLDFETPMSFGYEIRSYQRPGDEHPKEYTAKTDGPAQVVNFFSDPDAGIDHAGEVLEELQIIFDRSGIPMHFTRERPDTGDYHSVRFLQKLRYFDADGDGHREAILHGVAFQGVDRFNQNKNDIVAVFAPNDPLQFDSIEIAGITAHELTHAFGAKHINPNVNSADELLDYQDSTNETIHNGVAIILEPPTNQAAAAFDPSEPHVTHNPFYHISRYGVGSVDDDIVPGTWDVEGIRQLGLTFVIDTLNRDLDWVDLLSETPDYLLESDNHTAALAPTTNFRDLSSGDTISFVLDEGERFSFLGGSSGETNYDVFVELTDGNTEFVASEGFNADFLIRQVVGDELTTIGSGNLAQRFGRDLNPDSNGQILGTPEDDFLAGGIGDNTIDGRGGTDTVFYSGSQSAYTLTLSPTGTHLTDRRAESSGTDTQIDIERLDFDKDLLGVPFDLTTFAGLAGVAGDALESFIELYIAYFDRAPDAVGLNFWGTAFAKGSTLQEIATLFIDQDETRLTYPSSLTNEGFATAVYGNVLGRTADQVGFDFWVGALDSNAVGRDQFILGVLEGAKAAPPVDATPEFVAQQLADRSYLANKTDIGAYFAVHRGMSNLENASNALTIFDGSQTSIDDAVTAIDGFHTAALDGTTGEFLMPLVGILENPFGVDLLGVA